MKKITIEWCGIIKIACWNLFGESLNKHCSSKDLSKIVKNIGKQIECN